MSSNTAEAPSAATSKARGKARDVERRRAEERRRGLLVLVREFLLGAGRSVSAAAALAEDCAKAGFDLDACEADANVDLLLVMQEYEDYFEARFGKRPVLYRRSASSSGVSPKRKQQQQPRAQQQQKPPHSAGSAPNARERGLAAEQPLRLPKLQSTARASTTQQQRDEDTPPAVPASAPPELDFGLVGVPAPIVRAVGRSGGVVSASVTPSEAAAAANDDEDDNDDGSAKKRSGVPEGLFPSAELRELAEAINRDVISQDPGVRWDEIIGLETAKRLIKEAVVMPARYPHLFTGILSPWKGVLLFGPAGTGKTMLAKAVATEVKGCSFFNISASSIASKWRGDSEKLIRVLFDLARAKAPSTVFLDEIDALMGNRGDDGFEHEASRRTKTEMLVQMDGLVKSDAQVFVLAASNLPWTLDAAFLRRLEKRIYVPLPDVAAREALFKSLLPQDVGPGLPHDQLAGMTENFSGSDLHIVCKEAAMRPLRRLLAMLETCQDEDQKAAAKVGPVLIEDVLAALSSTRPTTQDCSRFAKWAAQFGSS